MSERNDMTCAELADVAAELALGVLTGRERAMAVAHLDTCETCREDVRQLMATGEQLVELLPAAEPPAGFETRVLERLGLPAPLPQPAGEEAGHRLISRRGDGPRDRGRSRDRARHGAGPHGAGRHGASRHGADRHGADRHGAPPASPGTRRAGRMRRALAAAVMGLAVIAAGLGGWRIGAGTPPAASQAAGQLTSASLLSVTHQDVGKIFLYSGTPRWLYMSVEMGAGQGTVTCQVVGENGQVITIGSFRLADGYGAWGSPDPGYAGTLRGARLVSADGTVLATAAFTR